MKFNLKLLLILLLLQPIILAGQSTYPQDYFGSPVDFKIFLSATFGELRPNHFHSGIDIKTQGVQGKPLYAVANGFVSRIGVAAGGYGKVIYIDHPNGFTSVYGHCLNFSKTIEEFVSAEQYKLESFEVNLFPEPEKFPVKKGELIAFAGNSGSSGGPHLHFEIRTTDEEEPVNPLFFGYKVKDIIKPTLQRLVVYPFGSFSQVSGRKKPKEFELAGWGTGYKIKVGDTIPVSGDIYFGIETHDLANDSDNKTGVFSIELFIDETLVYAHKMESFPFTESRCINSFIDYPNFVKNGRRVQKTRIEPGNKLSVYTTAKDNGIFSFQDNAIHELVYLVKDFFGNTSKLVFHVKSSPAKLSDVIKSVEEGNPEIVFDYDDDNDFETDDFRIFIPEGALYDTLHFKYSAGKHVKGTFSAVHHVHNKYTPLQSFCTLAIKPKMVSEKLKGKLLIARTGSKAGEYFAVGGEWDDDFIEVQIRDFGDYVVVADTIAPKIAPVNISPGKAIAAQKTIQVKISDNLAGIKTYRATMNGHWILMEYDPKNSLLTYKIDEWTKPGKNQFRLVVTDSRNNEKVYRTDLVK